MFREKYFWFTDVHLSSGFPFSRKHFCQKINQEKPKAVFITGDISNGLFLSSDLEYIANNSQSEIFFVLGNHDYYWTSISKTHSNIRNLVSKYRKLCWLTDVDFIELNQSTALIGEEGWYDGRIGNSSYLNLTADWFLIEEGRKCKNFQEKLDFYRQLSRSSNQSIKTKITNVLKKYNTIYLLTHFPPWREATRAQGTILESYWEPYNVNYLLGLELESIMNNNLDKKLVVLCGHTHTPSVINVNSNIECFVGDGNFFKKINKEQHIYI